jgi:hypothetical protein
MVGSRKRTYGKGGTASSQAVLDDPFLDENEIEEQMFKMSLRQEVAPLSSGDVAKPIPLADAVPVTQKGREIQSVPVSFFLVRILSLCPNQQDHGLTLGK